MNQSTVLLAAVRGALVFAMALAAMPLLRRASAATRRLVLVVAFGAVVALPLVSSVAPSWKVALPARALSPLVAAGVDGAPEPVARGVVPTDATSAAASPARDGESLARTSASSTWAPSLAQLALVVWALGALAVLARLGHGVARARRLARGATRVAVARLGTRVVEVRVSDDVEMPAVTGLFSPVVLLPRDALQWTEERRQLVLLHELAHVERRDCLAAFVAQIGCAIHWFDPLAWIAARRLRVERELAADDLVLRDGARPSSYAEHLLAIATQGRSHARPVPSGALAMAEASQIEERIRALLASGQARAPLGRATLAMVAVAVAGLVFVVACAKPDGTAPAGSSQAASAAAKPPSASPVAPSSAGVQRRGGVPLDAIARQAGASLDRVELTLDPVLQAIAEDETDRLMTEWKPRGAVVLVLDPSSGAVLAMTSRSPEPTAEVAVQALVPGSTMKSFTIAAALDEGAISEKQRFDCENGKRAYGKETLGDANPHGVLDVGAILAVSSNIGNAKIFDALGGEKLSLWTKRFHFGEASPVQVPNGATGAVPSPLADHSLKGALVATGEGLTATPIQIAAAFASIADGGVYHAPTLVRRVVGTDGRATWEPKVEGERVMRVETARIVMAMLEGVVTSPDGTGRAAGVEGVRVAGKTGTADLPHPEGTPETDEYYSSFVGAAPADRPRYVVLVGAIAPRDQGSGGKVAAPVFARIIARALAR